MRQVSVIILLLAFAGCAGPAKRPDSDAYERGYRQAVKEQYWIIQNQQREMKR